MDAKGEVLLTIMASLAQESESLSKNTKMGIQYRFQQGKVLVNARNFLGYDKDEVGASDYKSCGGGDRQAHFPRVSGGCSCKKIARGWSVTASVPHGAIHAGTTAPSVRYWNEKYMGDAFLQKTHHRLPE